ncbi:MAG TPA: peptide chain release factor N(5)-glutamine methyltransferase [Xanthomonadaceae bacterium]|nr:peptide chain release factor N(5)-glutamine methyltransferase [Xanthomonadaceae bacterium]
MRVGETITVAATLSRATTQLGNQVRPEAELLMAHALQRSRTWLFAHADDAVPDLARERFDGLLARRRNGEPIAQLLGRQGFWSLELRITPDVLIPRADTELLVERALAVLPLDTPTRVVDLGTGSGAIALAIAVERQVADIVAVDCSLAALEVARSNAEFLGLSSRVQWLHGEWCLPLRGQRFDAIVSNPPYLAEDDPHLSNGDLRYEPRSALVSGSDGLDAIRMIVRQAPSHLLPGGWLLLEHGWEQGAAVRTLFETSGCLEIATHRDIEQRERVTCGRWTFGPSAVRATSDASFRV